MWTHEESITIQATPDALWSVISEVAGWPRWDASLALGVATVKYAG
jgi:hypothetical protein